MQNSVAWTVISDVYTKGCGMLEWIMEESSAGSTQHVNKPVCVSCAIIHTTPLVDNGKVDG